MPKKSPEIEARKERVRRLLVIGLTQTEVAHRCGISQVQVHKWAPEGYNKARPTHLDGYKGQCVAPKTDAIITIPDRLRAAAITEDEGWELACAEIQARGREQHQHTERQMRVSRQLIEAVQYSVAILSTKEGRASIRRDFDQPASGLPFQISKETLEVASANLSAMAKEWK